MNLKSAPWLLIKSRIWWLLRKRCFCKKKKKTFSYKRYESFGEHKARFVERSFVKTFYCHLQSLYCIAVSNGFYLNERWTYIWIAIHTNISMDNLNLDYANRPQCWMGLCPSEINALVWLLSIPKNCGFLWDSRVWGLPLAKEKKRREKNYIWNT